VRTVFAFLVLALVALLTIGTALSLPLFLGPDEPQHLEYGVWIAEHGLPEPGTTTLLEAQHPPLYHAFLGQVHQAVKALEDPGTIVLPYERRVAVPAPGDPPGDAPWTPYLLRLSGLVLGLLSAATMLFVAARVFPGRRNLAMLAAALAVLIPQFSVNFATPNNDQFAILFGALGFGVVATQAGRGRASGWKRLLVAGILFGLGFLSKLLVLGPFVAAAFLVASAEARNGGRRLRALSLLACGPLLVSGWWFIWQLVATGTPHAVSTTFRHHPELLRPMAPDALGLVEILGKVAYSFLADVGRDHLTPGVLWTGAASVIPLVILGATWAGIRKKDGGVERSLCRAFAIGLAAQIAVLVYGNIQFAHVQGRYLYPLLLPGILALTAGLPRLMGRRAAPLLGLLVLLAAGGGLLLLHGRILPVYHSGHAIHGVPWKVDYVDLGGLAPNPKVAPSAQGRESDWYYSRPVGRWCFSQDPNNPVAVTFADLDRNSLYLLSVRRHPWQRFVGRDRVSACDILADGAQMSGPLSPSSIHTWPTFPVPRSAVHDGWFRALIRPQASIGGGLSEMLLRRLPVTYHQRTVDGDRLVVEFRSEGGSTMPALRVQLRSRSRPFGPIVPLVAEAGGRMSASLALPPAGTGPLQVLLRLPEGLFADALATPFRTRDRERAVGDEDAAGIFVLELDPEQDRGQVVASFPGVVFKPNTYQFRFRDGIGRDVTSAFRVQCDADGIVVARDGRTCTVDEELPVDSRLSFVFPGTERTRLGRVEAWASAYYIFDMHITR